MFATSACNTVSLAFTRDGRYLLASPNPDTVSLSDVADYHLMWEHTIPGRHTCLAISPDDTQVAVGTDHGSIWLLDRVTGMRLAFLPGHTSLIRALAFSPDGRTLVSGGLDNQLRFWNIETGQESLTIPTGTAQINGLAFSPDGHHLAFTTHDGLVRLLVADPP